MDWTQMDATSIETVRTATYSLGVVARVMGNVVGESTGVCKCIYRLFSEAMPKV